MEPTADPAPLGGATIARRAATLVPVVAAGALPWLSGSLDNDGPSTATLQHLDVMRYDHNRSLYLAVVFGTVAIVAAWIVAVWLLRDGSSRRWRRALGWLSLGGPVTFAVMALAYADPANGASPGAGLWVTGLAMPVIGGITLATGRRPPAPPSPERSARPIGDWRQLGVSIAVPATFVFIALPWASLHAWRMDPEGTRVPAPLARTESLVTLGSAYLTEPRRFVLLAGSIIAVIVAWAIVCLAAASVPRTWVAITVAAASVAGPVALHVLTRQLLADAADPGAALGLWLTTAWMPLVGLLAVFAGRRVDPGARRDGATLAASLTPLLFLALALPWAQGRNPTQYHDVFGPTVFDLGGRPPLIDRVDRVTVLIALIALWAVACVAGTRQRAPLIVVGTSLVTAVAVQLVTTGFLEPLALVDHLAGAWLASGAMIAGGGALAAWSAWSSARSEHGLRADDPVGLQLGER